MARTFASKRHAALVAFLHKKRKEAGLTQVQVAERLDRYQSFVTDYERGQIRGVMECAEADGLPVIARTRTSGGARVMSAKCYEPPSRPPLPRAGTSDIA